MACDGPSKKAMGWLIAAEARKRRKGNHKAEDSIFAET